MSDVSADVFAEGWVVPEDIAALSVFSFARCFGFILQGAPKHLAKEKTNSAAISSGTIHPSAKTSALTSDTDSSL